MELRKVNINTLIPYENNPRKNEDAVDAVAESIRQCGYCAPIICDEERVILAGHTRLKALQKLGREDCEVIFIENLTEEQKRKYRLLDNKTNEFALWDFEKLEAELADLDFDGFDFGFDTEEDEPKERKEASFSDAISVIIDCSDEEEAEEIFNRLQEEGYECRISTL